ncbi:hypothetical protein KY290_031447 [Solanum tuberosum]|uniref:DUF4283 domain-containing protein n=1 Tax=Solanum tuberosum TaxID=4113 RepID=A0ABQ7U967_SOLTU|nr:hypothetical protein KY289_030838 [Solanum tuberosum]KAH0743454.1 hypothetical protein KY290_031447 [Solanum tuberosum]
MVRERKKKEITKQVVTPTRMESENLGYPQGMEVNQGKELMDQWPPLPSKEVTPKLVGVLEVNTVSRPKVYYHNDGYFLVRFASVDDRNEVLYSGSHMLNNKPIIVKDSLSRISSGLGVPLYANECTTKVDRISFTRVLVEMNVARELPKKLKVEDPNGRVFEHVIQYKWIPEYCTKCMQVGHQCIRKEGIKPKAAPRMVNK